MIKIRRSNIEYCLAAEHAVHGDWTAADILVTVKPTHDDSSLHGMQGVIKNVSVSCFHIK